MATVGINVIAVGIGGAAGDAICTSQPRPGPVHEELPFLVRPFGTEGRWRLGGGGFLGLRLRQPGRLVDMSVRLQRGADLVLLIP